MYIRCITPQCAKYKRVSIVIQLFSTERSFQKELCTAYIFLLSDNQRTYTHSELQIVIFGLEKSIQLWLYTCDFFFEINSLKNTNHNSSIQNDDHFMTYNTFILHQFLNKSTYQSYLLPKVHDMEKKSFLFRWKAFPLPTFSKAQKGYV